MRWDKRACCENLKAWILFLEPKNKAERRELTLPSCPLIPLPHTLWHSHRYSYMYTHTHALTHACALTHMHPHIYMCTHTYIYVHIYMGTHTYTCAPSHEHRHTYTRAPIYARAHTCTHTNKHDNKTIKSHFKDNFWPLHMLVLVSTHIYNHKHTYIKRKKWYVMGWPFLGFLVALEKTSRLSHAEWWHRPRVRSRTFHHKDHFQVPFVFSHTLLPVHSSLLNPQPSLWGSPL